MLTGIPDVRDPCSMSKIIWFPGKPVLHSCPIGTECLRTHVKRPQGWFTFIWIPTLNSSLYLLLYNRISECHPFYFDSRSAPGGKDLRILHETIERSERAVRFCQRLPCIFSVLVLFPEKGKMKLLCFAAHRFAAELLYTLNAFCHRVLFSLRIATVLTTKKHLKMM